MRRNGLFFYIKCKTPRIQILVCLLLLFCISHLNPFISSVYADEDLHFILENEAAKRDNQNNSKPSELRRFLAKLAIEIQETISFNEKINKYFSVGYTNSRLIFPLSGGDFLVSDETELSASFHLNAFEKIKEKMNFNFSIQGAAKPSLKRFFISPAADRRRTKNNDYVSYPGPQDTNFLYFMNTEYFEISPGFNLSPEGFARYSDWLTRFTLAPKSNTLTDSEITGFPLNVKMADKMNVGEGYSFVYDGAASFGPSVIFDLIQEKSFSIKPYFKLNKVIRTGKFELIIVKTKVDKLLFSIRQIRSDIKDSFKTSWGVEVSSNIDIIVEQALPSYIPDDLTIITYDASKEFIKEHRFNSVYEIDLSNSVDRKIYDEALSDFNFSLFEVFTIQDISKASSILKKFKDSTIDLILNLKSKVTTSASQKKFQFLTYKKTTRLSSETYHDSKASFEDRDVLISGGILLNSYDSRSVLLDDKQKRFEIQAYEEYGPEAVSLPSDIVLVARKSLNDERTLITINQKNKEVQVDELSDHIKAFNRFTKTGRDIQIAKPKGVYDFERTRALMEFYFTRSDIKAIGQFSEAQLKAVLIEEMARRSSFLGFKMTKRRKAKLLRQDPEDWSFKIKRKVKNSFKSFILNKRKLLTALNIKDSQKQASESSKALIEMLINPEASDSYAYLFKYMLLASDIVPKINISFSNIFLNLEYRDFAFPRASNFGRGFLFQSKIDQVVRGESDFNIINKQHIKNVGILGSKIKFDFKNNFNGFLKISFKEDVARQDTTFKNLAELVIDLENLKTNSYTVDLNGSTPAERQLSGFLSNRMKIFIALSYDGLVFDSESEIER